jgi:alpha-mannosidase
MSSDAFFEALSAESDEWPVMVGELYFEYHRGTYTTQAATKASNRRCEFLLHEAEFLTVVATRLGGGYWSVHPEPLWQKLLTNQFHDILPGSSIALVYEDTARDHAEVAAGAEQMIADALESMAKTSDGTAISALAPVNTLGVPVRGVVDGPDGAPVAIEAPSYGVGVRVAPPAPVRVDENGDNKEITLDNGVLRAVIAGDGSLRSLVLLEGEREALAEPGNRFELYDDKPIEYDAWDIDPFHLETRTLCPPADRVRVTMTDPLRAEVAVERRIGEASRLTQTVRLDAGARRIEFATWVDWRESEKVLKVAFPVAVHAPNATYEMQFGATVRPTHFSTAADLARYEVPGHRWSDLSEHGFGVALLSDSKYGYSTHHNTMRMTLLRAPKYPDPTADIGEHRFRYALMPHLGGWQEGGVVAEGLRFNLPVRWAPGLAGPVSWFGCSDPNLILDTVKLAEEGGAIVLRLYEAHGARGTARVRVGLPFTAAHTANLLEDSGAELRVDGEEIVVPYRPWEIVTVLVA